MSEPSKPLNAATVAGRLAARLDELGREYALGGAIALGFWGAPRGTLDVDLTVFIPPERPTECLRLLQEVGCDFVASDTAESLREHGYCSVKYCEMRIDVFLPIIPFYEAARQRRKQLELAGHRVVVWDAESLAVFKMMFFRRKDLADVEQILRAQAGQFDFHWVRRQLAEICGVDDPRFSAWDEIVRDVLPDPHPLG